MPLQGVDGPRLLPLRSAVISGLADTAALAGPCYVNEGSLDLVQLFSMALQMLQNGQVLLQGVGGSLLSL